MALDNRWGKSRKIERDAGSWQKSLSYKWAVLQFAKSESVNDELAPPNIVVREETTRSLRAQQENTQPRRGVNDMLRDMRLENGHHCESRDQGIRNANATRAWSNFQKVEEIEESDQKARTKDSSDRVDNVPKEAKYVFEETFKPYPTSPSRTG